MGDAELEMNREILWRQYALHIDLYKEYLNLALKINGFYYVGTGAIVSFYFSKSQVPWMRGSLVFPALMSFGLAVLFVYGAAKAEVAREEVFSLAIKLGFVVVPEIAVLIVFLRLSAILMIVAGGGLLIIIFLPIAR
jgi:hypothetical protein